MLPAAAVLPRPRQQAPAVRSYYPAVLLLATLVGFALRLVLLNRFPFREDEALYSYWALYGSRVDPRFLTVWPDKPPLFIWSLGLWFQVLEAAPPSARLLNILFSTLTIPVLASTARRWWGDWAGIAAAVLAALNPYAVSFAPTAYVDPLLLLAGALALALAAHQRTFWAGLWLGVAIMTKQQGLLFVPLVLALLSFNFHSQDPSERIAFAFSQQATSKSRSRLSVFRAYLPHFAGVALIVLPVLYWDSQRWAVAPSPWDLGARNIGTLALVSFEHWPARLQGWGELAGYLLASNGLWLLLGLMLALQAARRIWMRAWPARPVRPAVVLGAWGLAFLLLHIAINIQIWDRYLLPLVLPLVLIGGWSAGELLAQVQRMAAGASIVSQAGPTPVVAGSKRARWPAALHTMFVLPPHFTLIAIGLIVFLSLARPAVQAATGRLPIGGDHGAYAGFDTAVSWLEQEASRSEGAASVVLYHRTLGWHFRFYLFSAVERGAVDLRWYPSAVYLADNATKAPHKRRFLLVPDWAAERDLTLHLATRRLMVQERLRAGHFTLYELVEQAGASGPWRLCRRQGLFPVMAISGNANMVCQ